MPPGPDRYSSDMMISTVLSHLVRRFTLAEITKTKGAGHVHRNAGLPESDRRQEAMMTRLIGRTVLLLAVVVLFGGCTERKPEQSAGEPGAQPADQPEQAPESRPAPPPAQQPQPSARPGPEQQQATPPKPDQPRATPGRAKPEPAPSATPPAPTTTPPAPAPEAAPPEPARPQPPAETSQGTPQTPAGTESKKAVAKDVVVLTGAPMGGVRLEHTLHAARAGNSCATCHHASKPEKPASAAQQACSDCHTKVASPPMKTKYQAAFHNPTAQSGTCIDCHKAENAKGQKAPAKCAECHKKENK